MGLLVFIRVIRVVRVSRIIRIIRIIMVMRVIRVVRVIRVIRVISDRCTMDRSSRVLSSDSESMSACSSALLVDCSYSSY